MAPCNANSKLWQNLYPEIKKNTSKIHLGIHESQVGKMTLYTWSIIILTFTITSIAARGGGGSFKRLKLYNSEEHLPIESFVTTLIHWTFFLMTRTKLAFVGFVAAGNSMWHQLLDDLCLVVTDQSATTWDSSYAPNSTQYNSILQSSEKCYPSTILYYKVLVQTVLLQYYSVLQSTSPVLLRTTKYYCSTTPYYKRTTKY